MHLPVLDGLRGIAALVVLLFHTAQQHDLTLFPYAGLAVDFFYILSGFVIALAYEGKLVSGMRFRDFMALRLIRLYPLIALGTLLGILLAVASFAVQGKPNLHEILAAGALGLLLLPSFVFPEWPTAYPFNMAAWSLFFEVAVNAVYAMVARYLRPVVLAGILIGSGVLLAILTFRHGAILGGNDQDNWHLGFVRVMFPFFLGVCLFRLRPSAFRTSNGAAFTLAIVLGAALLLQTHHGALHDLGYVMLLFPAIVWIGAGLNVSGWMLSACRWLGELSYPVYILQSPILRIGAEMKRRLHPGESGALLIDFAEIALVILIATIALKFFDEPVRAMLSEFVRAGGSRTSTPKETNSIAARRD